MMLACNGLATSRGAGRALFPIATALSSGGRGFVLAKLPAYQSASIRSPAVGQRARGSKSRVTTHFFNPIKGSASSCTSCKVSNTRAHKVSEVDAYTQRINMDSVKQSSQVDSAVQPDKAKQLIAEDVIYKDQEKEMERLKRLVEGFEREFEVVRSIAPRNGEVVRRGDLLVLDSSFNPPTKAHLNIVLASLKIATGTDRVVAWDSSSQLWSEEEAKNIKGHPCNRILLLLAVQNADKAPQPASFDHRLAMMTLLAHSLLRLLPPNITSSPLPIDIGITKHARFLDKAASLRSIYPNTDDMVFLTGYDTLIRIFDPKYYGGTLKPLGRFFQEGNRIRCFLRPMGEGGDAGWRKEQEGYVMDIREGNREGEGCERAWGERIELIEHGMDLPVSSTLVRSAARAGDAEVLGEMLPEAVKEWVLDKRLFRD
ncbi:hypothetical protein BDZ91DRAFT_712736 [Kalaharituber pfeilii]|nr:hypothetical protein BDZ91DRAFT_712736 [Kalaharituber pfeilii]